MKIQRESWYECEDRAARTPDFVEYSVLGSGACKNLSLREKEIKEILTSSLRKCIM